jgi:3-oxoacyl-[acyl-carrier protein] reductase
MESSLLVAFRACDGIGYHLCCGKHFQLKFFNQRPIIMDRNNELVGKVAIVTGSARNIGRATAEELARGGASLVINSVQAEDLCNEVVDGIRANGGKAIPFMADVRDADTVQAMVAAATAEFGGVDIMIHNAAVRSNIPFDDLDWDTFKTSVDISIQGAFNLAKAVLPTMKQRGGGSIIGVGGMSSLAGSPGRSHVMAGKMGLNAFIRGLALDLAGDNYPRQSGRRRDFRHGARRQSFLGINARSGSAVEHVKNSSGPPGRTAGHGQPHPFPGGSRRVVHHRADHAFQRRWLHEFIGSFSWSLI